MLGVESPDSAARYPAVLAFATGQLAYWGIRDIPCTCDMRAYLLFSGDPGAIHVRGSLLSLHRYGFHFLLENNQSIKTAI